MNDRLATRGFRFNLRTALVCVALIAFLVGWYTSTERQRGRNAKLYQQLASAQVQITVASARAKMQADTPGNHARAHGVLSGAKVEAVNLRDAIIQGGDSAFQRTVFDESDLTNASLSGGAASFQGASFKNAILRNAKLMGGGASFQLATFDGADLSGGVLTGNLQGASLRNVKCAGVTISGSLQAANLDGAQFQNADLSAVRSVDLESCYYDAPPSYDANTKFPDGFDPAGSGWKKSDTDVEAASR